MFLRAAPDRCLLQTKEQSFARRDLLLKIQADAQRKWDDDKVFNAEPPAAGVQSKSSKAVPPKGRARCHTGGPAAAGFCLLHLF